MPSLQPPWKRLGQEVRRSHSGLHRTERMLDGLSTLAHCFWICIKTLLYSIEQMLMLPSWDPPLRPGRAWGLSEQFRQAVVHTTGLSTAATPPLFDGLAASTILEGRHICSTGITDIEALPSDSQRR